MKLIGFYERLLFSASKLLFRPPRSLLMVIMILSGLTITYRARESLRRRMNWLELYPDWMGYLIRRSAGVI